MLWELKRLKIREEYKKHYADLELGINLSSEQGHLGFTNQDKGKYQYKNEFRKEFNSMIKKLKKDGTIHKILKKYLGNNIIYYSK